jgi:hypothetical protein
MARQGIKPCACNCYSLPPSQRRPPFEHRRHHSEPAVLPHSASLAGGRHRCGWRPTTPSGATRRTGRCSTPCQNSPSERETRPRRFGRPRFAVCGAAPTFIDRVRAAVRAACHAAKSDAPARWRTRGPRLLVEAAGRPARGAPRRLGSRRVAEGRGRGAARIGPAAWAGVRRDDRRAGVRAGRAGGPAILRVRSGGRGVAMGPSVGTSSRTWRGGCSFCRCWASSSSAHCASSWAPRGCRRTRAGAVRRSSEAGVARRLRTEGPSGAARGGGRPKLEALRAEAGYEPGKVTALKRRVVELQRRPPSTDREQAIEDLDANMRRERERVVRRISATELQQRRDEQGLTELTRVEKERGAGGRAVQLGVFPTSAAWHQHSSMILA